MLEGKALSVKTPTLRTARLILRPLALEDAPAIQNHFANWNVIQHIGGRVPWPYPADGAETFLREDALPRILNGDAHFWAICLKDAPNELIGVIEFRVVTKVDDHRGFWLAEPFWKRGLMSEAVEAVNRFVFEDLGVDSFLEENAANNAASRCLKEKSGGEFLRYRECVYPSGERRSEVWRLTRAGWLAKRGTQQ
jgi:ribosomal-protein-alanine N-acetyltransferase